MTTRPARRGRAQLVGSAVALLVAASVAGCGRRGALEPPVDPSIAARPPASGVAADARVRPGARRQTSGAAPSTALATRGADVVADAPDDPDDDEDDTARTVSPIPTPKKRVRAYAVPKEPFLLDPLL